MEKPKSLHFILLPFMSRSRIIPFVDLAKILSQRGFKVTIALTSSSANIFHHNLKSFYPRISTIILNLPAKEAGLPDGCDTIDLLPSPHLYSSFFSASAMLQHQLQTYLVESKTMPNVMISDVCLPWTTQLADKFHMPRVIFHVNSCFTLVSSNNTQAMESLRLGNLLPLFEEAEKSAEGALVNTFEELESDYVSLYRQRMKSVWCVGPVSSIDSCEEEHNIFKWLHPRRAESVIYVCFGSLCRFSKEQMVEIGLGLEASGFPFIWVIGKGEHPWLEEGGFKDRLIRRGFLVKGWAPQVKILNHPSVKGFVTHCGWNSTLEGISAGVPMATCPMLDEQFLNETFIVHVLKIGVAIRTETSHDIRDLIKMEDISVAVNKLMRGDVDSYDRINNVKKLSNLANKTVLSGSSLVNITSFIHHFLDKI